MLLSKNRDSVHAMQEASNLSFVSWELSDANLYNALSIGKQLQGKIKANLYNALSLGKQFARKNKSKAMCKEKLK